MKKLFLLCTFTCLLTAARAQRLHSMEFGIGLAACFWTDEE